MSQNFLMKVKMNIILKFLAVDHSGVLLVV
jgi:hypothetical protein